MCEITLITQRNYIFTPEGNHVKLGYKIALKSPFCGFAYFSLMYFLEIAVY